MHFLLTVKEHSFFFFKPGIKFLCITLYSHYDKFDKSAQ